MKTSVLLIEDNPALSRSLMDRLGAEGFSVEWASSGPAGLELAAAGRHDVIILDGMLPGMDGLDVLQRLRGQRLLTPVLMLTARGQTSDKVVGLTYGADDYMTKPFEMVELLARLRALLRRQRPALSEKVLEVGRLRVDIDRGEARVSGEVVELAAREWALLVYLLRHPERVLTREELLSEVWGHDGYPVTRTVDVHVAQLRQKVERDPAHPKIIVTVHGMGYKLRT